MLCSLRVQDGGALGRVCAVDGCTQDLHGPPPPPPLPRIPQAQHKASETAQQAQHAADRGHTQGAHTAGAQIGKGGAHCALGAGFCAEGRKWGCRCLEGFEGPPPATRPPAAHRYPATITPSGEAQTGIGAKVDEMKHRAQAEIDKARAS